MHFLKISIMDGVKVGQIQEYDKTMLNQQWSYSHKVLFLVLTIGLIPLIVLSTFLYFDKIETETNSLKIQLTSISETDSKIISDWINERKNIIFAIAQDSSIITSTKILSNSETQNKYKFDTSMKLVNDLENFHENFPDLQSFVISKPTGEVLFYTELIPPGINLKNENHFQQAINGVVGTSSVFLSSASIPNEFGEFRKETPTMFISAPIEGEVGIEGILTARLNFLKINSIIEENDSFHSLEKYVVNSEGYFLSKSKFIGEAIGLGLIDTRPELKLQTVNYDLNQFTDIFELKNNEKTVFELEGYENYLGKTVIGSISPIKNTNWSYISEIEKNEAFSGIYFIQILITFVISIVLLIIIITSFYFSSTLTTPIKKLQEMAEQVTKGNLDIKDTIKSNDELGQLSNSFDHMIESLKKTTDIETQLALQQNLKNALDESSIVSMINPNRIVTFVNDKFCKISKYSKEELIGNDQSMIRSNIHSKVFYDKLWEVIKTGSVWHGEICNKAKDGTLFWNQTTIVPFADKDGVIYEYVAIRYDITHQKELSKKLIEIERLSAIGELAARIAHDIRNPLSVIKNSLGNMQLLKNDTAKMDKTIERCDRAVDRIAHQIDGVMGFIKESPLEINRLSLLEIIQSSMVGISNHEGVNIIIPKNDVSILGDKIKIESLMYNLIINAVQKLNGNGTITIKADEDETINKSIITISDDGEPIPEEFLTKIFEPLITTKQQGTGLGLASCKKIIEQHDGFISVSNNPVTFTIILPTREA